MVTLVAPSIVSLPDRDTVIAFAELSVFLITYGLPGVHVAAAGSVQVIAPLDASTGKKKFSSAVKLAVLETEIPNARLAQYIICLNHGIICQVLPSPATGSLGINGVGSIAINAPTD
jgi:hypothetical protein